MGGSEMGGVNLDGMRGLMLINRELALEAAREKSERFTAMFRRSRVFEKTFERVLEQSNRFIGVPTDVSLGLPEEYFDPKASFPHEQPVSYTERGFTPDYDLEPDDVFERNSYYDE